MKLQRLFSTSVWMLAVAGVGMSSAIAADTGTRFYMGGNIGQSKANIDTAGFSAAVLATGLVTTAATTSNKNDTGFKIFAGYRFHPNFAVEGGYFDLGKFGLATMTTGLDGTIGTNTGTVENNAGLNLDLVGIIPINDQYSLFGRAGVQNSVTKVSFVVVGPGGPASFAYRENNTDYKAGLGMQYDFNKNIGARLEWERYRVPNGIGIGEKANVDLFSVGLLARF